MNHSSAVKKGLLQEAKTFFQERFLSVTQCCSAAVLRCCAVSEKSDVHPFLVLQLVETENVRGVITMNEMYETKYFCNSAEVSLLVIGISLWC